MSDYFDTVIRCAYADYHDALEAYAAARMAYFKAVSYFEDLHYATEAAYRRALKDRDTAAAALYHAGDLRDRIRMRLAHALTLAAAE